MSLNDKNIYRDAKILKMHLEGETPKVISAASGISAERVRQILKTFFRIFNHPRYKEIASYPFPRETHPHLWEEIYPGGFMLDRKNLKPEEKDQDKAHWLKLLNVYLISHQVKSIDWHQIRSTCECGMLIYNAGGPKKCTACGSEIELPKIDTPVIDSILGKKKG